MEVRCLLHGLESVAKQVQIQSALLFDGELDSLSPGDILHAFQGTSSFSLLSKEDWIGKSLVSLAKEVGLVPSISMHSSIEHVEQARKQIGFGGFYLNQLKVTEPDRVFQESDLIHGCLCLLRIGKSHYKVLRMT